VLFEEAETGAGGGLGALAVGAALDAGEGLVTLWRRGCMGRTDLLRREDMVVV
jgi:hypothetical protein